jgi:hypothetical protein
VLLGNRCSGTNAVRWRGTEPGLRVVTTAFAATITFTNGSTQTFPAAINWLKIAGGGDCDLTIGSGVTVNDGYTPTVDYSKTYILEWAPSSYGLSSGFTNDLDGSANTGTALRLIARLKHRRDLTLLAFA